MFLLIFIAYQFIAITKKHGLKVKRQITRLLTSRLTSHFRVYYRTNFSFCSVLNIINLKKMFDSIVEMKSIR
jgi:hypothetical protein